MKKVIPLIIILITVITSYYKDENEVNKHKPKNAITVKKIDKQWFFINTDNEKFISRGISVVSYRGDVDAATGINLFEEAMLEKYPNNPPDGDINKEAWAADALSIIKNLKFNSLGSWCQNKYFLNDLYFVTFLQCTENAMFDEQNKDDYFSCEFAEKVREIVNEKYEEVKDSPNFIGYILDGELRWYPIPFRSVPSEQKGVVFHYLNMAAVQKGKQKIVEYFKGQYSDDLNDFTEDWAPSGVIFSNWEEVGNYTSFDSSKYRNLKIKKIEQKATGFIAGQYYRVCSKEIKKIDPCHLILSDEYVPAFTPYSVLTAASKYVDVVCVNHYNYLFDYQEVIPRIINYLNKIDLSGLDYLGADFPVLLADVLTNVQGAAVTAPPGIPQETIDIMIQNTVYALLSTLGVNVVKTDDFLKDFYLITKKPILITEFGFRAITEENPSNIPFMYPSFQNQEERGAATLNYVMNALENKYVIGYHLFQWKDQPKGGRLNPPDGENNNFGILDIFGNLSYPDYYDYLMIINQQ